MQNRALRFIFQLVGFAFVGAVFFIWFLGNKANALSLNLTESKVLTASVNMDKPDDLYKNEDDGLTSADFSGPEYEKAIIPDLEAPETVTAFASEKPAGLEVNKVKLVRSWKGVHRDIPYATIANERFKDQVVRLSDKYGLYPEIFMARIIAYSYDYVLTPERDPVDRNFTGMQLPDSDQRAQFKDVSESLRAYAVVNAGEITRLSPAGALAKHGRSWTMQKIIEGNNFISDLAANLRPERIYTGMVSRVNKVSAEENEKREVVGETVKMISQVENQVKTDEAKSAGYENWDDYMDNLNEKEIAKKEEGANKKIAAISKKKSLHLKRRVAAKN